jgi:hypothetical protein
VEADEVDGGMQVARDFVEKLRREVWPPAQVHGGAQVGDRSGWKRIDQSQLYIFSRVTGKVSSRVLCI